MGAVRISKKKSNRPAKSQAAASNARSAPPPPPFSDKIRPARRPEYVGANRERVEDWTHTNKSEKLDVDAIARFERKTRADFARLVVRTTKRMMSG
jgi:hypothetical protein